MRYRCEHEIIRDMLVCLRDRPLPTPLNILYGWAKIGSGIQEKYYDILKKCNLALITEHETSEGITIFKAIITNRGIQFLTFYEAIEKLMRSGFHDTQKNVQRSI